jgi:hypothetical protein
MKNDLGERLSIAIYHLCMFLDHYRTQDQRAKLYSASSLSQTRCLDGVLMHAKHTNFSKAILTAKSTLLESLPKGVDHSSTDAGLQMPDP